jgi:hypothetical protein
MDADFIPGTPVALLELDLDDLVGSSVDKARAVLEAAGGRLRAVAPGQAVTMDYRGDRVTATVENDRICEVLGIG